MALFLDSLAIIVLISISSCTVLADLYDSSSAVINLTPSNFESRVIDSSDVWIVEFYAPWCGHCKNLVPEYKKAAEALKGVVKVGAVNADEHRDLGGRYGIKGFPTIKIFGRNKKSPTDYQGSRSAQGFVDAGMKELRSIVDARLGGKSSSGGTGSSGGGKASPKDIIELTDTNFESKVLESNDLWLVEFFAPWCGHCKNLAPIWAQAASELKGKVKLGALDATVHTEMAQKYNIRGFPTIKVFGAGKKDGSAEDYEGGRTVSDIVNFALEKLTETLPPPEVVQLTNDKQLAKVAEDSQLVIVSVLPHILDCQSKCRNGYLDALQRIAEKFKKNRWSYIWMEAGVQPDIEEAFEIGGFGYPAMAVLNPRKLKYSVLRGSFSFEGINEFLRELTFGRGSSLAIRAGKLPKVETTELWDGKDGELPKEEDIDLSDVTLDEPASKTEL